MSEEQALYVRDGDAFVGTGCTKGSWHANGQSGGAVLSLLGHVLEDVPTLAPMSLSRLTVDIVRPVPVGERLWVEQVVVREGKRIQVVDSVLRSADAELVRARALRIRDADLTSVEELPPSSTDDDPAARLPPPEELHGVSDAPGVADFLRFGAELRRTLDPLDGVHGAWVRLRVPVVAGEPVRATSRVALPMDCVNLLGVPRITPQLSAINADVSAHVVRAPVGEWVALVGSTRFAHAVGHGVSMATLSDAQGVFGITSTSQVVQLRD
jgi:hypothetical protein